ncbi:DivIVA domain-containing protein [Micromonospora sp. NPDC000207]|uniref:DivIVA domain-containing protein n=1 Tax=Micromonospora sp. NPDC000207 TaxID=3154246 RepID=UPI00331DBD9C
MRFFRQLRRRRRRQPLRWTTCYRSAASRPLPPGQVRQRRFGWTAFGRRGLDPAEVYAFLDRVAGELSAAYEALASSREEADRVKGALRRWQSEQFQARNERRWQE